jgi:hypothetical protein
MYRAEVPNVEDCVRFLEDVLSPERGPLIKTVVDAMDEADHACAYQIYETLSHLLSTTDRLGYMITDRRLPPRQLHGLRRNNIGILMMRGQRIAQDVAAYVTSAVHHLAEMHHLTAPIEKEICDAIVSVADGTFLQARLAIGHLSGSGTRYWTPNIVRERLEAIRSMTPDIESFYCGLFYYRSRMISAHTPRRYSQSSALRELRSLFEVFNTPLLWTKITRAWPT